MTAVCAYFAMLAAVFAAIFAFLGALYPPAHCQYIKAVPHRAGVFKCSEKP